MDEALTTCRLFLSNVSDELPGIRGKIIVALAQPDFVIHHQEGLRTGSGKLLETLDDYIGRWPDVVIHLVGRFAGKPALAAELAWLNEQYPDFFTTRFPFLNANREFAPRSAADPVDTRALTYTQMEAWLALYHKKPCLEYRARSLETDPLPSTDPQEIHWRRLKDQAEHRKQYHDEVELLRKILADISYIRDVCQRRIEGTQPPLLMPEHQNARAFDASKISISDLRYGDQFLPYRGRATAQQQLDEFLFAQEPFLWWGIVGEGGVGKTRLAFETAQRLQQDHQWNAGFLDLGRGRQWLLETCQTWRPQRPTLLILDYPAQRTGELVDGLSMLARHFSSSKMAGKSQPVRLLILGRPGQIFPVSSELLTESGTLEGHENERRKRIRQFLFQPQSAPGPQTARGKDNSAESLSDVSSRNEPAVAAIHEKELARFWNVPNIAEQLFHD